MNDNECSEAEMTSIGYFNHGQATDESAIAHAIAAELQSQTPSGRFAPALVSVTREGLDRRRLSRVLEFIEDNLEGDLTIVRLAGIACLSRFHFARAFKAATGQTPHQCVSAKRLARAKALLLGGDRSLIDISLALGFSGQANFTRAFRQLTGQAPGKYRRQFGLR
jgi:AraC family transcriptional regulator